jgi:hypothetical protein
MRIATSAVLLAAAAVSAPAQMVVSAHSGTVHYYEGDVSIDGVQVNSRPGHFEELKEQSVLRTARGRAEVLLTPGVFLRVGENSAVRMLDNRLVSTRVEIVSGGATVETDAQPGDNGKYKNPAVTVIFKSYEIELVKDGLLEINTDPAQVRVFKGEARVQAGDNRATVRDGHEVFLTAALATDKFDEKTTADDNYIWARDRSAVVSAANMSSARMLANNSGGGSLLSGGYGGGYFGASPWASSMFGGGWYFNPYFGMYTYMPLNGFAFSPFGYGFYSPGMINSVYAPGGGYWYGGSGARTASVIGRPVGGTGFIGRPVGSASGSLTRGTGFNSAALRPVSPSANVISSRAANGAMAGQSGGFSRGGGAASAAAAGGGGGGIARPSGGISAGGGMRSGGGVARGR